MVSEFTAEGISAKRDTKDDVPFLTRSKSELPPSLLAATEEIRQAENAASSSPFKAGASPNSGQPSPRFGGSQDYQPWKKENTGSSIFSTSKPSAGSSLFSTTTPSGSPYKSTSSTSLFGKSATGTSSPSKPSTNIFSAKAGSASSSTSYTGGGNLFQSSSSSAP